MIVQTELNNSKNDANFNSSNIEIIILEAYRTAQDMAISIGKDDDLIKDKLFNIQESSELAKDLLKLNTLTESEVFVINDINSDDEYYDEENDDDPASDDEYYDIKHDAEETNDQPNCNEEYYDIENDDDDQYCDVEYDADEDDIGDDFVVELNGEVDARGKARLLGSNVLAVLPSSIEGSLVNFLAVSTLQEAIVSVQ